MVTCFNCTLQVQLPSKNSKILSCPRCSKDTCRECNDEAHIPLKCSEVEKKSQTNARVTLEEAMTQARLRTCYKCKSNFYKTEGCNKMTCSCGAYMCYVCRKPITNEMYKHFCQLPHCNHKTCGNCKLFSNSVEDDRLAMLEAGMTVVNATKDTLDPTNEKNPDQSVVMKLLEGGNANLPPSVIRPNQQVNRNVPPPPMARNLGRTPPAIRHIPHIHPPPPVVQPPPVMRYIPQANLNVNQPPLHRHGHQPATANRNIPQPPQINYNIYQPPQNLDYDNIQRQIRDLQQLAAATGKATNKRARRV